MDNFIYKSEKALPYKMCLELIKLFGNEKLKCQIKRGPLNRRTAMTNKYYYDSLGLQASKFKFSKILKSELKTYVRKYPYLSKTPFKICSICNLQRYKSGQSYTGEHCENDGNNGNLSLILMRNIAWMFYLNDISLNGGTCFPNQQITLIPRAGDLYIWPAYWTHSHFGIAAEEEEKYILTGWCRYLTQSEMAN